MPKDNKPEISDVQTHHWLETDEDGKHFFFAELRILTADGKKRDMEMKCPVAVEYWKDLQETIQDSVVGRLKEQTHTNVPSDPQKKFGEV